jgi:hypothetical protein
MAKRDRNRSKTSLTANAKRPCGSLRRCVGGAASIAGVLGASARLQPPSAPTPAYVAPVRDLRVSARSALAFGGSPAGPAGGRIGSWPGRRGAGRADRHGRMGRRFAVRPRGGAQWVEACWRTVPATQNASRRTPKTPAKRPSPFPRGVSFRGRIPGVTVFRPSAQPRSIRCFR